MKCPVCGSTEFYVKDPDDEYACYEFEITPDGIKFDSAETAREAPEIKDETEIYCSKCS